MSVSVRGVGTLNSDVAQLQSQLANELHDYGLELQAAIDSGFNAVDAAQFQNTFNQLLSQNDALTGARPSADVLTQLQALEAQVQAWRSRFRAKATDAGLVKIFVVGSLVIVGAGALMFWAINKSLKRRRRKSH
jgi:hypothetical protein